MLRTRLSAVLAPAKGTHKFIAVLTVSASVLCIGMMVPQAADGVGFFAPLVISTGLCVLVTLQVNWPRSWKSATTTTVLFEDAGRRAPDGDGSAGWSAAEEKRGKHENWEVDLLAESAWNDHFGQYTSWHCEAAER
ncbi:unnamed protein product [Victoria cruziana]